MNSENIAAVSLLFAVGGALITFGIMYGSLKKEQESFEKSFAEFKQDIKDDIHTLRKEIRALSGRVHCPVDFPQRED